MFKKLDIENWNRKSYFHFFKNYDNPFFSITANVDVTNLYAFAKKEKLSFFLTSLYFSTKVCNEIENFRYRIRKNEVIIHDKIDAGSTYLNDDKTFEFIYFHYFNDLKHFHENGKRQIKLHKNKKNIAARPKRDDEIHYSVVPWISFTSFSHATNYRTQDSVPRINFGKYFKQGGKLLMPVSVDVHHALMDGYHVGLYFEQFQKSMNEL